MSTVPLVEDAQVSPEVRAVSDGIMATRKTDQVNKLLQGAREPPAHPAPDLGEREGDHG